MKQELINQSNENLNLLKAVYEQSNHICKQRHEKPTFISDQTYLEKMQRMNLNSFNSRQTYAFKELFNWRNLMARQEDESENFVLKDHELISICSNLPREMQGILALCNPVPPLVRQNLVQLHEFILKAREQPLGVELHVQKGAQVIKSHVNPGEILGDPLRSPLNCHWEEDDLELPCLITKDDMKKVRGKTLLIDFLKKDDKMKIVRPQVSVFDDEIFQKKEQKIEISCVSPFERYEKTKSMMNQVVQTAETRYVFQKLMGTNRDLDGNFCT